jgi:hypothetical protein
MIFSHVVVPHMRTVFMLSCHTQVTQLKVCTCTPRLGASLGHRTELLCQAHFLACSACPGCPIQCACSLDHILALINGAEQKEQQS